MAFYYLGNCMWYKYTGGSSSSYVHPLGGSVRLLVSVDFGFALTSNCRFGGRVENLKTQIEVCSLYFVSFWMMNTERNVVSAADNGCLELAEVSSRHLMVLDRIVRHSGWLPPPWNILGHRKSSIAGTMLETMLCLY
jgi:hypothetical protein